MAVTHPPFHPVVPSPFSKHCCPRRSRSPTPVSLLFYPPPSGALVPSPSLLSLLAFPTPGPSNRNHPPTITHTPLSSPLSCEKGPLVASFSLSLFPPLLFPIGPSPILTPSLLLLFPFGVYQVSPFPFLSPSHLSLFFLFLFELSTNLRFLGFLSLFSSVLSWSLFAFFFLFVPPFLDYHRFASVSLSCDRPFAISFSFLSSPAPKAVDTPSLPIRFPLSTSTIQQTHLPFFHPLHPSFSHGFFAASFVLTSHSTVSSCTTSRNPRTIAFLPVVFRDLAATPNHHRDFDSFRQFFARFPPASTTAKSENKNPIGKGAPVFWIPANPLPRHCRMHSFQSSRSHSFCTTKNSCD